MNNGKALVNTNKKNNYAMNKMKNMLTQKNKNGTLMTQIIKIFNYFSVFILKNQRYQRSIIHYAKALLGKKYEKQKIMQLSPFHFHLSPDY